MAVTLSIKHVPEGVARALRGRATRNRRSLQGELLALVERAAHEPAAPTLEEIYARGRKLGLSAPRGESARIVRRMRDQRSQRLTSVSGRPRGRR